MPTSPDVPTKLWKYRTWDENNFARDMIVDGQIYFAKAADLNDPFEMGWHEQYPKHPSEQRKLAKALIAARYPRMTVAEKKPLIQQLAREIAEHAKRNGGISRTTAVINLGVFCASAVR